MLKQPRSEQDHKNIIEEGFTLVELLIVIVIMGILAGIVVFAVGNLTQNAASNGCKTEADTFATAYQAYKTQATAAQWTTFTGLASVQAQATSLMGSNLLTFSGAGLKYLSNVAGQGGLAVPPAPNWTSVIGTGVVTESTC